MFNNSKTNISKMKTIASLLSRAKTLKRFGSRTAVERQLAKIIEHPDFEALCSILDSFQKLSFVSKANEEVVDDYELVEDLNEQDVLDLDLDISLDHDAEEAKDAEAEEDFEIVLDEDLEESTMDTSRKACSNEAEAKLAKAKLAASPKKILVSKASILAKKKSLG